VLSERDPQAVLLVLPADQHVTDKAAFARVLDAALAAAERDDSIATIGITPTRAETGFGYLEVEAATPGVATPVKRFVEKPDRATAEQYVASGRYLWNAGIFCARAQRILAELDAHLPVTAKAVREIAREPSTARTLYPALPSISFDHAVMEHTAAGAVLPVELDWDDVGSWEAVARLVGVDATGNVVRGAGRVRDASGNILYAEGGRITVIGASGLLVVHAGDETFVCARERLPEVRELLRSLETPA
jgi:mannose-1-phosphate guanylyltransferase